MWNAVDRVAGSDVYRSFNARDSQLIRDVVISRAAGEGVLIGGTRGESSVRGHLRAACSFRCAASSSSPAPPWCILRI